MVSQALKHLEELQPDSGKRILGNLRGLRMYLQDTGREPVLLVKPKQVANGQWKYTVQNPESLIRPEGRSATRRVMTLPIAMEDNYTLMLNTALLGGKDYPVLTAVLGSGAGLASGGAGLFFSAGTTALNLGKNSSRVLARGGDEIWQVEEIGKEQTTGPSVPTHVLSYFLVDPYRKTAGRKAWLIHEERREISI